MLALRAVDIDTAAAPARIPDQPVGVDHRAVDTAAAPPGDERDRLAARRAARRIEINPEQRILPGVREIADLSVRREADRVRNRDLLIKARQLAAMQSIDGAEAPLRLAAHGA